MIRSVKLIVPALALLVLSACDNQEQKSAMPEPESESSGIDGLSLSTATQTNARASQLPTDPSEDVSSLLGDIKLPNQSRVDTDDYLPSTALEWVVHATFEDSLAAKEVASRFGKDWRAKYGGLTIYGLDASTGNWTFLISADGPKRVSGLQFAWTYYASWSDDQELASPEMYRSRISAVESGLNEMTTTKVRAEVEPEEAFKKAQFLSTLTERFDRSVAVRVVAPAGKRFSGKELWDVMLCLGLRWGDMDCFHWQNPSGYGDNYFFSVWTSTRPGYFLPEEVAADRVQVEDLIFGYSIPRSGDPVAVFSRMVKAAKYAQKRLGGTITGQDDRPFNSAATLKEIQTIADELTKLGFKPGSDNALRQF